MAVPVAKSAIRIVWSEALATSEVRMVGWIRKLKDFLMILCWRLNLF
jgi:hypothetical protein